MDSFKLRHLTAEDKGYVLEMLQDPEVMRFLGPRRALTEDEAVNWFDEELDLQSRYVIALISNNELIGFCGVKEIDGVLDFGYFFRKVYWGQGYATKVCKRVIDQIRDSYDIESLQVFIAKENEASLAVAKKLDWQKLSEAVKDNELGYYYRLT